MQPQWEGHCRQKNNINQQSRFWGCFSCRSVLTVVNPTHWWESLNFWKVRNKRQKKEKERGTSLFIQLFLVLFMIQCRITVCKFSAGTLHVIDSALQNKSMTATYFIVYVMQWLKLLQINFECFTIWYMLCCNVLKPKILHLSQGL